MEHGMACRVGVVLITALFVVPAFAQERAPSAPNTQAPSQTSTGPSTGTKHHQTQRGLASYYGPGFEGKTTSSGKTFHADDPHVVASKTVPLGSTVKVTNVRNGRSVTAKVVDRGPHKPGRVVDVSQAAAAQLNMTKKGVVPVKVTVVKTPAESEKGTSASRTKGAGVDTTHP
jgi:rare lipoprotein A